MANSLFVGKIDEVATTINLGLSHLSRKDATIRKALKKWGYPEPRISEVGFPTLLRVIVGQQLSRWAADAICLRLQDAGAFSAIKCARMTESRLTKLGLSRRKVGYAKGLAKAFVTGELDVDKIEMMEDEEAIGLLRSYHGIGLWTAEIYLMFAHARMDIFPAGDLALRGSLSILGVGDGGEKGFVNETVARSVSEGWRPYRSCVALLLWRIYGAERRGAGKPLADSK